jgi:hypothetical protein
VGTAPGVPLDLRGVDKLRLLDLLIESNHVESAPVESTGRLYKFDISQVKGGIGDPGNYQKNPAAMAILSKYTLSGDLKTVSKTWVPHNKAESDP